MPWPTKMYGIWGVERYCIAPVCRPLCNSGTSEKYWMELLPHFFYGVRGKQAGGLTDGHQRSCNGVAGLQGGNKGKIGGQLAISLTGQFSAKVQVLKRLEAAHDAATGAAAWL